MAARALLLSFVLAMGLVPAAIAATPTGGAGAPQHQTGGFSSIPAGEPAPAPPASAPATVVAAGPGATTRAASTSHARPARAQRSQSGDVVDVPVPGGPDLVKRGTSPAAAPAADQLASTGFDLGLFTALGCLFTALGLGLAALMGPRERLSD